MICKEWQYDDLVDLICGELLGSGIHRKVFNFDHDTTCVIKCAVDDPAPNVLEFEVWCMVMETNLKKWFAPCVRLSGCGMFLIQKKVEVRPHSEYPKLVPSFFSDLKYKNFGWIDGQFVCCDYSGFISTSMTHKWNGRMKKAEWWGD